MPHLAHSAAVPHPACRCCCCPRLDFAKRRATPPGCKCRMVLPSNGENSISLWDTQDPQALHEWLNDNLGADCTTVLSEVQEDFCFGLSLDLARMRAADKVCSVWGRGWQGLQVAALCIDGRSIGVRGSSCCSCTGHSSHCMNKPHKASCMAWHGMSTSCSQSSCLGSRSEGPDYLLQEAERVCHP
jgi:hypothetical protein